VKPARAIAGTDHFCSWRAFLRHFRSAVFLALPPQMKLARAFGFQVSMEALRPCLRTRGGRLKALIIMRPRRPAAALTLNAAVGFKPA
jgi:hypothetical protein